MGKFNLKLLIMILAILVIIMQLRSCFVGKNKAVQNTVIVQTESAAVTDGLDLQAVGDLLSEAENAEDLERQINGKDGINNLDLNQDGIVDFIKVTEFGSGSERGFALSTELGEGEEQEIATIHISESAGTADVQIQGNETLYGSNHYYNSRLGLGNVLLLSWLFRPHVPYYSPFAFGYYPNYYGGGYRTVSQTAYRSRTQKAGQAASSSFKKSNKPQFQTKTSSPKAGANAVRRRSLSNPTRSQRSFSTRSSSRNGTSSSRSIRRSSSFRSGSSFGGGK